MKNRFKRFFSWPAASTRLKPGVKENAFTEQLGSLRYALGFCRGFPRDLIWLWRLGW
jgi:hypothetical protein